MIFPKGTRVEVSSDEPGFIGVWYVGRIVCKRKLHALVEYDDLVTEQGEPLKEDVSLDHIRPIPPLIPIKHWVKGEPVEVFDKDGWWQGVVLDVLPGGRFLVYFKHSEEETVFPASMIRCRQDWCEEKWNLVGQAGRDKMIAVSVFSMDTSAKCKDTERPLMRKRETSTAQSDSMSERKKARPNMIQGCSNLIPTQNAKLAICSEGSQKFEMQLDDVETQLGREESISPGKQKCYGNLAEEELSPSQQSGRTANKHVLTEPLSKGCFSQGGYHLDSASPKGYRSDQTDRSGKSKVAVSNKVVRKASAKQRNKNGKSNCLQFPVQRTEGASKEVAAMALSKKANYTGKVWDGLKCEGRDNKKGVGSARASERGGKVELTAYFWLLKAVHSKGTLGWKEEMMLTDARSVLSISNEQHATQLRRVISSCVYK